MAVTLTMFGFAMMRPQNPKMRAIAIALPVVMPAVLKERLPDPSVTSAWPLVPSAVGSVSVRLEFVLPDCMVVVPVPLALPLTTMLLMIYSGFGYLSLTAWIADFHASMPP